MTQRHLDHAVAIRTGESLRTVRHLGFTTLAIHLDSENPEHLQLVVDCPFCRQAVPYSEPAADGSETLAECLSCDVYFDCDSDDVYATSLGTTRAAG